MNMLGSESLLYSLAKESSPRQALYEISLRGNSRFSCDRGQIRLTCDFSTTTTTRSSNNKAQADTENGDPIFQMASSNLKFGPGSTKEVGQDISTMLSSGGKDRPSRHVIIVTDPNIAKMPNIINKVTESLGDNHITYEIYDQVRVEPNDLSFQHAISYFATTAGNAATSIDRRRHA